MNTAINTTTGLNPMDYRANGKNTTYIQGRTRVSRIKNGPAESRGEMRVINRISMRITLEDRQKIRAIISTMVDENGKLVFNSSIDFFHEAIAQFLDRKPFASRNFVFPDVHRQTNPKDRIGLKANETWVPYLMEVEPKYEAALENWRYEYERRTGTKVSKTQFSLAAIKYFLSLLGK